MASFCWGAGFTLLVVTALNLTSPMHRTALAGPAATSGILGVMNPAEGGARPPPLKLAESAPPTVASDNVTRAPPRLVEIPPAEPVDPIAANAFETSGSASDRAVLAGPPLVLPPVDTAEPVLEWAAPHTVAEVAAPPDRTRPATTASIQDVAPTLTVAPSSAKPASPKLAGKWAPKLSACLRKEGEYLPLVIDGKGARAGEATCSFRDTQQTGARWNVVAACSSTTESWTSKVSLHVTAKALTWTSERGSQNYVRCG